MELNFLAYIKKTNNPKMGRPIADEPRVHHVSVRLSDKELNILDELISRTGKKRSEVVIDGIMLLSKSLSEN